MPVEVGRSAPDRRVTGTPQPLDRAHHAELGVGRQLADASPQPWAKKRSGRAAVIAGSFWRSDPAAALRGLAKILPPRLRLPLVERGEVGLRHVDLAADLEHVRARRRRSALRNVGDRARRSAVTSSPTVPSPRVAASTSSPFS